MYSEGWADYHYGFDLGDNPYSLTYQYTSWVDWRSGWWDACKKNEDEVEIV